MLPYLTTDLSIIHIFKKVNPIDVHISTYSRVKDIDISIHIIN